MQENVILSRFCAYRAGGPARYYLKPENRAELKAGLAQAQNNQCPVLILGAGSNILVADSGFKGLAIHLKDNFAELEINGREAIAGAGCPLSRLVWATVGRGRRGLQRLAGIPGTVGGAVYMNAGAYESQVADCLAWVESMDFNGRENRYQAADLAFGYRSSRFGREPEVILRAGFHLAAGEPDELRAEAGGILSRRLARQPLEWPSCGSVFKRPTGQYAGQLIEGLGLKGLACGPARVSEKHANFIVNTGAATATEIHALIRQVQKRVQQERGVTLEPEVRLVGFDG